MTKKLIILIIVTSSVIWVFSSFLFLNNFNNKDINYLEEKIINVSEKASSSIVSIVEKKDLEIYKKNKYWFFDNTVWWWTGFFVNKNWIIITNNHVVENKNSSYIIILNNWKEFNVKIIYSDKNKDIAFLKVLSTDGFNPLNKDNTFQKFIPLKFIEKKEKLKIWQFVLSIWNTLSEYNNSVSFWIISWLNRKIENNYINLENLIQTDANINPWNSGWPLINLEWKVIWINTLIINWNHNIGFAISLNQNEIEKYLNKIKTK